MRKINIIFILLAFLLIPFTFSQPVFDPVIVVGEGPREFEIVVPEFTEFVVDENIKLHFHVYNATGILMKNDTVDCYFHLYNRTQSHIVETELNFDSNLLEWDITINQNNFTLGEGYQYIVWCNSTTPSVMGGFTEFGFNIVSGGHEGSQDNWLPIMLYFLFLMGFFIWVGYLNQKAKNKILMFLSYSMAMMQLFISTFIVWNGLDSGASITNLLRTNFIIILLVGGGIGILSLFLFALKMINVGDALKEEGDKEKWQKDSKW